MANFNLPVVTSDCANVWDYVKAVQASLAVWMDSTTDTNIPVGSKRWSDSNRRFEEWNGTAWVELLPIADDEQPYQIRVAMANECSGNAATAGRADNSLSLGGVLAAQFVQTTDERLSNSRQCNNAFDNAATARTNLDVYSKSETGTVISSAISSKANTDSPALTGTPTAPTAAAGANNVQIATTAFVSRLLTNRIYVGSYSGIYDATESGDTNRERAVLTLPFNPVIALVFSDQGQFSSTMVGAAQSEWNAGIQISGSGIIAYSFYNAPTTYNTYDITGVTYYVLAIGWP